MHLVDADGKGRVTMWNGIARSRMTHPANAVVRLAYAFTVHKAQGSQAPEVVVLCEKWTSLFNDVRWLYTAITRAEKKCTVVCTPEIEKMMRLQPMCVNACAHFM
jgi:exodeoxyribonuclease V alpha subunit